MTAVTDMESTCVFESEAQRLIGILHTPKSTNETGVVIVVGGPQYRVGSHRQFVLLARDLAAAGFATLRFDYCGMGDSEGMLRGFEHVQSEMRAAIDYLFRCQPTLKRVVLWGLCDGATAASFYAPTDARVSGLVLLNPWVRSEQTLARSLLFHYYAERLTDLAAWKKMLFSPKAVRDACLSLVKVAKRALIQQPELPADRNDNRDKSPVTRQSTNSVPLVTRMAASLDRFAGQILLIISTADITANEFLQAEQGNSKLRKRLSTATVVRHSLEGANHTFSRQVWRDRVSVWTCEWLSKLN